MRTPFRILAGLALAVVGAISAMPAHAAQEEIAVLGDSYSAGLGAGNYISDGTNCSRSRNAFGAQIGAANGLSVDFQACSGAIINDVRSKQLGALDANTKYVTISVGGNDVGFADIITKCHAPFTNQKLCLDNITAAQQKAETQMAPNLERLYREIRDRAPKAKVVVAGYPILIGNCSPFHVVTKTETAAINAATHKLNDIIRDRAQRAGFTFADVRPAFQGKAICDKPEWIHNIVWSNLSHSYHPKLEGQKYGYTPTVAYRLGLRSGTATATSVKITTGAETSSDTTRGVVFD